MNREHCARCGRFLPVKKGVVYILKYPLPDFAPPDPDDYQDLFCEIHGRELEKMTLREGKVLRRVEFDEEAELAQGEDGEVVMEVYHRPNTTDATGTNP